MSRYPVRQINSQAIETLCLAYILANKNNSDTVLRVGWRAGHYAERRSKQEDLFLTWSTMPRQSTFFLHTVMCSLQPSYATMGLYVHNYLGTLIQRIEHSLSILSWFLNCSTMVPLFWFCKLDWDVSLFWTCTNKTHKTVGEQPKPYLFWSAQFQECRRKRL